MEQMIASFKTISQDRGAVWVHKEFERWFKPEYMDADYIRSNLQFREAASGRGGVLYFTVNSRELVHRHYRRGGWMARWFKDRYLRTGKIHRRCVKELQLLDEAVQRGLPVPRPVAASCLNSRWFYRCDIVTEAIPGARSLGQVLRSTRLDPQVWQSVGGTIARFHQENVWHADLNANNVLLDEDNKVYLVDFDRCRLRLTGGRWREANLKRLEHSLLGLKKVYADYRFEPIYMQHLMAGYRSRPSR